jgi:hypothetical protein
MTATALYKWFISPQDLPPEVRKDALARVSMHAVLAGLLFWILAKFPVELVYEIFASGNGRIPAGIRVVLIPAEFTQAWAILAAGVMIVGLAAELNFYTHLHRISGEKAVKFWSYGTVAFLSTASAYCLYIWFHFKLMELSHYAWLGDYRF